MRLSTYQETHKDTIEHTIHTRFANQLRQLRSLGFTDTFYIRETWFPFSVLLLSPKMIGLVASGEIVRVGGVLQAMVFNPFLVYEEGYAYAEVLRQGINYITLFDDGLILKTPTFNSGHLSRRPDRYIVQVATHNPALTYETAWRQHVWRVKRLMGDGRLTIAPLNVTEIIHCESQIDRLSYGFQREIWQITNPKRESAEI